MLYFFQSVLTAEERSSTLSALFFSWLDPLVWSGFRSPLTQDQVPRVRPSLDAGNIGAEFNRHFAPTGQPKVFQGTENAANVKDDMEMVDIVKIANEDNGTAVAVVDGDNKKKAKGQNILVPLVKAFGTNFAESVALKVRG